MIHPGWLRNPDRQDGSVAQLEDSMGFDVSINPGVFFFLIRNAWGFSIFDHMGEAQATILGVVPSSTPEATGVLLNGWFIGSQPA